MKDFLLQGERGGDYNRNQNSERQGAFRCPACTIMKGKENRIV